MKRDATLLELEQKPMGRLLWQYSLPAIIGMAAMSIYNIVDAIYIGRFCGAYAMAGMAIVFPLVNLTVAFGTLIGLGSAANASIALGQGDMNRAYRVLGHCVVLGLLGGVLLAALCIPFLRPLLLFFGATADTLQPAYDFMLVTMLGFPLSSSFMNLNHLMRASGYPAKAMVSLLISMLVNIAAAHLFIYEWEWGMTGAGLATVVAQGVGMLWVGAHYLRRRSVLHLRRGIYKLSKPIMLRIMAVGLPPCLLNAVGCVIVVFFNSLLLRYEGDMGVGAFGVVNRIVFFFVMVVLGITQGMQPIAGYNLGLGNYRRVRSVFFRALIASALVMSAGWLLIQGMPRVLVGAFVNVQDADSARLADLAVRGMRLLTIFFPLVATQVVVGNFFQAIGRPVMSIILNLTRQLIVLVPALLLLPPRLGDAGIWLSQSVADFVSSLLAAVVVYLFFTRVFRRSSRPL